MRYARKRVRQNFWPLRSFTDLADVNAQARQWSKEVANQRQHRETGQKPDERFQPESLRPLPAMIPDYRDTAEALVYKDTARTQAYPSIVRRQPVLRAASLCGLEAHCQSGLLLRHHL